MSAKGDDKGKGVVPAASSSALVAFAAEVASNIGGAGIALEGSTISVLLGAAAVPVIQTAASNLTGRRARAFDSRLQKHGVSPQAILASIVDDAEHFDLFRSAVSAALDTENEVKRRLLADVLLTGLMSADSVRASYARRVIGTISRIDTLEIIALGALEDAIQSGTGGVANRSEIVLAFREDAVDVLDAALAVLQSEGLVMQTAASEDGRWRLTGYGRLLLGELRSADGDG